LDANGSKGRYRASAYIRFASRKNRLSADDLDDLRISIGGTPGRLIFSIRLAVKVFVWRRLRVAMENIFEVTYRALGAGVNGAGRNLIVSCEMSKDQSINFS
jgi:hypothetical protein